MTDEHVNDPAPTEGQPVPTKGSEVPAASTWSPFGPVPAKDGASGSTQAPADKPQVPESPENPPESAQDASGDPEKPEVGSGSSEGDPGHSEPVAIEGGSVHDAELVGPVPPEQPQVTPVKVDSRTKRNDDDALEGHFVKVIAGEHQGVVGAFENVDTYADDGYPERVIVRSRDAQNQLLVVDYKDVRPADPYRGGR